MYEISTLFLHLAEKYQQVRLTRFLSLFSS